MKKNYDFTKAQKGVLYRPMENLGIPVYLDDDVSRQLKQRAGRKGEVSKLVNALLRHQIESAKLLK